MIRRHAFGMLLLLPMVAMALDAPAVGDKCMVVTAEPQATRAALTVLRDGGTAVDAVVTAAFVLAVTEPYASGLGGGGFAVGYQPEDESSYALDFRETAPAGATRDMFLGPDHEVDPALSRTGALSVAVPGFVRGLWDLHQRHGRLPWNRLVEPAVDLARDGFPVSQILARKLAYHHARGRFDAAFQSVFLPAGQPLAEGQSLHQLNLARTLAAIAEQGPDAFYEGSVAAALVRAVGEGDGVLSLADLAGYHTVWRKPVTGRYRGLEIISMPPPSSGGVHLVQMLNILESYDLAAAGYGSAAAWHPLLEAMKFAFADRSRYLGDPDFVDVPATWLTSRAHADSQRAFIRSDRAVPLAEIEGASCTSGVVESEHTTHVSIVDVEGRAVAATFTINLSFGAGMIAPGTGVILNDEMDDFAAAPGQPNAFGLIQGERNAVAPHRRPLSSMTPTIVLDGGAPFMVTGSPGGSKIITATLQTILNVVDFGMDAREAVSVPRIHHQWYPETGYFEHFGLAPEVRIDLESRGHLLTARSPMGNVQVIVRDRSAGVWTGASDPRGMGLAAGF